MNRLTTTALVLGLIVLAGGCGRSEKLRTQGRLLKGGDPYIPDEGEYIQITFVPMPEDGKPPDRHYYAGVNQETGTFVPDGADKLGMPAGRYRVAVELMKNKKDLLGGKFDQEFSPYIFDVDEDTDEIVIDLDKPPRPSAATLPPPSAATPYPPRAASND
jgi:hypothetical protein